LKTDVLRLGDIESLRIEQLALLQKKAVAIRRSAMRIVDFLKSLENFQRRLWRKKKFVLGTNWIFSAGVLTDDARKQFESNTLWRHQVEEWSRLGIAIEFPDSPETALSFLAQHPALPIDTRIIARAEFPFDPASWISHEGTVDDCTTGILINSENSQALRLLEKTFSESVKTVYGDPPYNTGDDFFAYKDGFFDSSWMSMIAGTVSALKPLLRDDGLVFMSIDRDEHHNLLPLLFQLFGKSNFVEEIVWQKAYGGGAKTKLVNNLHEYIVCFANSRENLPKLWLPPNDGAARYYRFQDEKVATRGKYRTQPLYTNSNDYRENLTYPLPVPPIADPGSDLWESELKQIREDLKEGRLVVEQNGAKWNVLHNGSDWRGELVRPPKQWQWSWDKTCQAYINNELVFRLENGEWTVDYKQYELLENGEPRGTKPGSIEIGPYTQSGTSDLRALFDSEVAKFPKPVDLLKKLCSYDYTDRNGIYLDPFVGSGTTAQAVLALNCADNGSRKFIAMESSITCDVARDRICKCMASSAWEDGKTKQVSGALQVIKYFALESYEDALNNLPSPDGKLFEAMDQVTRDSLITYSLDLELGPHLLNMDSFKDPWGYKIYAQLAGEDEVSLHNVDMAETFNYLIGLKVQAYGPIERYSAEFVRLPHGDDKDAKGNPLPDDKREGRLRVEGRLRRDAEGPYVYQRVEGELNDGNATRVLVIWRKLTDDAEKDAAVLEAWMARHRETTKERSDYREYHLIYLNGPITLPQPTQELRTVLPTEQTFKDRMFEDTEV
jgi:adenine-specific DNA-methyltransferase